MKINLNEKYEHTEESNSHVGDENEEATCVEHSRTSDEMDWVAHLIFDWQNLNRTPLNGKLYVLAA